MARIEFSQVATNYIGYWFFRGASPQYGTAAIYGPLMTETGYVSPPLTWRCFINVMKGTPPTSWSELTTPSSRSADVLVTIPNTSDQIYALSDININNNYVVINSPFVAATQSGTASWFWLFAVQDTTILGPQMIGTNITGVGGGGDLEISDINVVSGSLYRVSNLRINFKGTFDY